MALIICPNCGNLISDKAPFCPKCGLKDPLSHIADDSAASDRSSQNPNPPTVSPYDRLPLPYPGDDNLHPSYSDGDPNDIDPDNNRQAHSIRALWILIIILLIAAIGLGTYLFIDNKKENERLDAERREQLRRDSIAAEEARREAEARAATLEQLRRDSIEWYSFTSPDLTLLDLHGHVKSVSYSDQAYELSYLYTFSTTFRLNEQGQFSNITPSRDSSGQTIKISDNYGEHQMTIKWLGNYPKTYEGFESDSGENGTFVYSDGKLKSISSEGGAEGCSFRQTTSFTPTDTDEYGNWIRVTLSINGTTECDDAYSCYSSREPYSRTVTITRTIEYYPFLQ